MSTGGVSKARLCSPLLIWEALSGQGPSFFQAGENAVLKPSIFPAHDALGEAIYGAIFFMMTDPCHERVVRIQPIRNVLAEVGDQLTDSRSFPHLWLRGIPERRGHGEE